MVSNPFLTQKTETLTGAATVHKDIWHTVKVISFLIGWLVVPFIPLYLSEPYPFLFYTVLSLYIVFFIYINHFKMNYHWTETVVFIGFFLFCVFVMKSLIDYHVIDEKEIVKTATMYGTVQ